VDTTTYNKTKSFVSNIGDVLCYTYSDYKYMYLFSYLWWDFFCL